MNVPLPDPSAKLTVEEYLDFIEARPDGERWQLIDGVAMLMPQPTLRHQRVASNLCYVLTDHFRERCLPLAPIFRIGLVVPGAELFRPFGDVAVTDETAGGDDSAFVERFYMVAEVVSDGDSERDIRAKCRHYIRHPQNLYFLLIEQDRARVEVRARAEGWEPVEIKGRDAVLELPEWGFRISLATLYDGTTLGAVEKT
jgi:Uma2 family endonuclease